MKEALGKVSVWLRRFFELFWLRLKSGVFRDKNYWWILLVAGVVLIQLVSKNYMNGDDTRYHLSNIQAIMEAWRSGHFDLKIFPTIANDLGYGSGIFYPQLFHVVAAAFGLVFSPFTSSLAWAMKATHFLGMFLSGATMYILMKNVVKDKRAALVSAIIYMMMPYHIADVLFRDAQAESLVFVFLPMVVLGLKNLIEKNYRGFYGWFIIGYAGLVYSHVAMTMLITLMLAIGLIINYKKFFRKETLKKFCLATVITAILCAPFLVPMMEHRFFGTEYRVFADEVMVTREELAVRAKPLYRLAVLTDDKGTLVNGASNVIALMVAILGLVRYRQLKVRGDKFFIVSIMTAMMIMGIIMYSNLFPWEKAYDFLWPIQFLFRIQVVIAFSVSVMAGIYLGSVKKEEEAAVRYLLLGSAVMIWAVMLGAKGIDWGKLEDFNYELSWSGCGYSMEYMPMKTDTETIRMRGQEILTVTGDATTEVIENDTPDLIFEIKGKGRVELPRFYYLGYKIRNMGTGKVIGYEESENGLIEAEVEEGEYRVSYEGTTAGKIANVLAGVTVVGGGVAILKKRR